jgi:hypothetical protein
MADVPSNHRHFEVFRHSLLFLVRLYLIRGFTVSEPHAEIVGSNPTGGMDFLSVVSVVCCQVEVSATD